MVIQSPAFKEILVVKYCDKYSIFFDELRKILWIKKNYWTTTSHFITKDLYVRHIYNTSLSEKFGDTKK